MADERGRHSVHQKLEQFRAAEAWRAAKKAKEKFPNTYKEYISLVKKLPALISTNGLGQTLAFLAAKGGTKNGKIDDGKPDGLLYRQLEAWLTRPEQKENGAEQREPYHSPYGRFLQECGADREVAPLLCCIGKSNSTVYRRATREAIAFASWLRSFADALSEQSKGSK